MNKFPDQLSQSIKHITDWHSSDSSMTNSMCSNFILTESYSSDHSEEISNKENRSVVVKSTCQDYKGILEGLSSKPVKLNEKDSNSMALTTAKGSLVEQQKKMENTPTEILNSNIFTVPGRFFCNFCEQNVMSCIQFKKSERGFFGSLKVMLRDSRCCAGNEEQVDIVHKCPLCMKVLVRITDI